MGSNREGSVMGGGDNYTWVFDKDFEQSSIKGWMEHNWFSLCSWATCLYLVFIFGAQAYMRDREPFHLRSPLAVWSASLAMFSMIGSVKTGTEFVTILTNQGLYQSVCSPSFIAEDSVAAFWTWMFVLSKLPELGDTVFIVLRKQKLIFLHWYHHLTVLIYVFYCFCEFTSSARWFMNMNYFVHSVMYSYYALRAMKVKVPRGVAMLITSLQLIQMVIGCAINYLAYNFKNSGKFCGVTHKNLLFGSLMYASYFVLFARFFYNAYFSKTEKKPKDNSETPDKF